MCHFDEVVGKHGLIKEVLGTLHVVTVLVFKETVLTVRIDSNKKIFTLLGVQSSRVDGVFKEFESVIDRVKCIEIGAWDVGLEAGFAKLMACDTFLNGLSNLEMHKICINAHILHLQVHDDVEARELDLWLECFATVENSEHDFRNNNSRRAHISLPLLFVKGLRWEFRSHRVTIWIPKSLKAAPDSIRVADFTNNRTIRISAIVLTICLGRSLRVSLSSLLFDPGGELIKHLLGQRQFFTLEELSHLCIYEFTGVIETAFVLNIITVKVKNRD